MVVKFSMCCGDRGDQFISSKILRGTGVLVCRHQNYRPNCLYYFRCAVACRCDPKYRSSSTIKLSITWRIISERFQGNLQRFFSRHVLIWRCRINRGSRHGNKGQRTGSAKDYKRSRPKSYHFLYPPHFDYLRNDTMESCYRTEQSICSSFQQCWPPWCSPYHEFCATNSCSLSS